jgi:hypothetical protein
MKAKWIKRLPCLLLCLGLTTAAIAQSNTPSVLDLVQNVDDPELGELIRVAIENQEKFRSLNQEEILELTHKVTLSYIQIKLFNQQIQEVSRKIGEKTGPVEMRHSLLLAKTELEAKRMTEVANLREIMGIIPRHPFEEQPVEILNTWLAINVIDERVYILDGLKPFHDNWQARRWEPAGLLSERETLNNIRERLQSKGSLPIRIDIYYKSSTKAAAEDLRSKVISLATEAKAQMVTEVHTELSIWVGSGVSTFYLRDGKIKTLYPFAMQRPDGEEKPFISGLVNPNDIEQHILWRLTMPKNVPLTFRIEYDEASALMARQIAETARAIVKRFGIADVVKVEEALVQPVPEAAFLGRWQAVADAEIQELVLLAGGQSQLTIRSGALMRDDRPVVVDPLSSQSWPMATAKKTLPTVPAPWILSTKEIFIDIGRNYIYKGYINAEGNLFLDKGGIYPQGSWHDGGQPEMTFRKVE